MNREIDIQNSNTDEVKLQSQAQGSESEIAHSTLSLEATAVDNSTSDLRSVKGFSELQIDSQSVTSIASEDNLSVLPPVQIVKSEGEQEKVSTQGKPEQSFGDVKEVPSLDSTRYIGTDSKLQNNASEPAGLFGMLLAETPTAGSSKAILLGQETFITKPEVAEFKKLGRSESEVESLTSRETIAHGLGLGTAIELNTASYNVQLGSATVVESGEVKMTLSPQEYVAAKVRISADQNPVVAHAPHNGGSDSPVVVPVAANAGSEIPAVVPVAANTGSEIPAVVPVAANTGSEIPAVVLVAANAGSDKPIVVPALANAGSDKPSDARVVESRVPVGPGLVVVNSSDSNAVVASDRAVVARPDSDAPVVASNDKPAAGLFGTLLAETPTAGSSKAILLGQETFITKPEVAEFKKLGRSESEVESLTSRETIAHGLGLGTATELNTASYNVQPRSATVVESGEVKMTLSPQEYVAAKVRISADQNPVVAHAPHNAGNDSSLVVPVIANGGSEIPAVVPVAANTGSEIPAVVPVAANAGSDKPIVVPALANAGSDKPSDARVVESRVPVGPGLVVVNSSDSNAVVASDRAVVARPDSDAPVVASNDKPAAGLFGTLLAETPTAGSSKAILLGQETFITKPEVAEFKKLGRSESEVESLTSRETIAHGLGLGTATELNTASYNVQPRSATVVESGEVKMTLSPQEYVAAKVRISADQNPVVAHAPHNAGSELPVVIPVAANGGSELPKVVPVIANDGSDKPSDARVVESRVPVGLGSVVVNAPDSNAVVVSDSTVVARRASDAPVVASNDKPAAGPFGGLLAEAPTAGSSSAILLGQETFITKPEVAEFKKLGRLESEVESLTSRETIAHGLGLRTATELNTASFNAQPRSATVVESGEVKMTLSPQEYVAAKVRISEVANPVVAYTPHNAGSELPVVVPVAVNGSSHKPGEVRPSEAPAPSLSELQVVRTTNVVDSGESDSVNPGQSQGSLFAGLLKNGTTAGTPSAVALAEDKFITKGEVATFKERHVAEADVERLDTRTALATSLGFGTVAALNANSINKPLPASRPDSEVAASIPVKPNSESPISNSSSELITGLRSREQNSIEPIRLNNLPQSIDSVSVVQVAKIDEVRVTTEKKQPNLVDSIDSAPLKVANLVDSNDSGSNFIPVAKSNDSSIASTKYSAGYQVSEFDSAKFSPVVEVRQNSSLMRSSSLQLVSGENQISALTQGTRALFEVTDSGQKSISGIESVKNSVIGAKAFSSLNNSTFDYNSIKRVAETVMSLESGKSAVSYNSVKLGVAATNFVPLTSTGVSRVEGTIPQINIDTTSSKSSSVNTTINTLVGSIFDTVTVNSQIVKVGGVHKGASALVGQTDMTSFDASKGNMVSVAKFDGVPLSSTERTIGTTISLSSKTDLSAGTVKIDGKAINVSLDGIINITKFDISNNTTKSVNTQHVNVVPVTNNSGKGEAAIVSVKADSVIAGVKTDSVAKVDPAQVKSVDAVIQTAKSFVNNTTAPAIIAAIKYGEPLPEGMTYESGFVKLTHNGQVLYFPGLTAALKFVEGLGSKVDVDDEEWYVDTLDAEGKSSRVKYIVVPGDTIESICDQRLGDVRYKDLLITINRSEIVYRSLDGVKVPFVYPSQIIMLPNRYERKVFRKNFFSANASHEIITTTDSNAHSKDESSSSPNSPASSPDKLLAKLHQEVVEHYAPQNRAKNIAGKSQGSLSSQLGITIERVRFAGGKESINLKEYKESLGPLSQSRFHEVQAGDSLLTIAKNDTNLGDTRFWKLIAKVNGLTTRLDAFGIPCEALVPGQHLLVPDRKQIVEYCLQESIPTPKTNSDPITVVKFSPGDTVITSEVEVKSYSSSCRSTFASSPASQKDFTINLQFRNGDSWQTVTCYQSRNGRTVRNTYTKDGVQSTMVIDLPASVVKEMAYEEFERSWKLRCGMYTLGSKADTKNRIAKGEKPVLVSDVV